MSSYNKTLLIQIMLQAYETIFDFTTGDETSLTNIGNSNSFAAEIEGKKINSTFYVNKIDSVYPNYISDLGIEFSGIEKLILTPSNLNENEGPPMNIIIRAIILDSGNIMLLFYQPNFLLIYYSPYDSSLLAIIGRYNTYTIAQIPTENWFILSFTLPETEDEICFDSMLRIQEETSWQYLTNYCPSELDFTLDQLPTIEIGGELHGIINSLEVYVPSESLPAEEIMSK
jgi:hypothetical protein